MHHFDTTTTILISSYNYRYTPWKKWVLCQAEYMTWWRQMIYHVTVIENRDAVLKYACEVPT